MIQFEYLTKVYYKDVDQMGIVYYAPVSYTHLTLPTKA